MLYYTTSVKNYNEICICVREGSRMTFNLSPIEDLHLPVATDKLQ